ncbi:hypothetical protein BH09PSE5_BH09PSE5_06860 [soil metagenome]
MTELTEKQRLARESFDLDAAMAALPPYGPLDLAPASHRGEGGIRLRASLAADISDGLLREFARETLGAVRCSEQYLDALRIVLGNQAAAELHGYTLEMNQRVSFAPQRVMRTIIDQMQAAGVSFGSVVGLGNGRSQVVQCFAGKGGGYRTPADALEHSYRQTEAADDARYEAAIAAGTVSEQAPTFSDPYLTINESDVPY